MTRLASAVRYCGVTAKAAAAQEAAREPSEPRAATPKTPGRMAKALSVWPLHEEGGATGAPTYKGNTRGEHFEYAG